MSTSHFTSDQHFGHNNVLTGWGDKSNARPFTSLEDMTEGLIERHNAKVSRGDLVYHLGDMFWRTFGLGNAVNVMRRLNGQHFYIRGNHEELIDHRDSEVLRNHFVWIRERTRIRPNDILCPKGIVLDHFAGRVWDKSHNGSWQLYGHSHSQLPENESLSFDVGVDANDYYPVSLEEVAARMKVKGRTKETT